MQPLDLRIGQVRAGGIVRVIEQHHPRAGRYCSKDIVDRCGEILVLRKNRPRADFLGEQRIEREGEAREQHLVADTGEGLNRAVEQFTRAGAADDQRRVDAVEFAQRCTQRDTVRIGIARSLLALHHRR